MDVPESFTDLLNTRMQVKKRVISQPIFLRDIKCFSSVECFSVFVIIGNNEVLKYA